MELNKKIETEKSDCYNYVPVTLINPKYDKCYNGHKLY